MQQTNSPDTRWSKITILETKTWIPETMYRFQQLLNIWMKI